MRRAGTTSRGGSFSEQVIKDVWEKGAVVPGHDAKQYRKDVCGALMKRDLYGDTRSDMGWEIDHIRPVVKGGTDDLYNLQPLQWNNNRTKGDNYPDWKCAVPTQTSRRS